MSVTETSPAADAGADQPRCPASLVESSDDVLLSILSCLTAKERLRFCSVSKRWSALAHAPRAPHHGHAWHELDSCGCCA